MSIRFDPGQRTLTLLTKNTSYQMRLSETGYLVHLYYGLRVEDCLTSLYEPADVGFSPNPLSRRMDRTWSIDILGQEYSSGNTADFRTAALNCRNADGARGADLRVAGWSVSRGKYRLDGLPCAFDPNGDCETLSVVLADPGAGVEAELLYGVFEERDVITRAVRLRNTGAGPLILEKAASACLDLAYGDWELLHFHGRHAMERIPERTPLMHGIETVSSRRGASGHQQNPFVILCRAGTDEDTGECCGVMPVYSGNHRTDVELDQMGSVRIVTGIHDETFSWTLEPGELFTAPEVLFCYSGGGLGELSRRCHRFLRHNLCRSPWTFRRRPVLLNNWEATYFDFDTQKLLRIGREAAGLGIELFVLDDGWFGDRSDDNRALGDWNVNEKKLSGGLDALIGQLEAMGLKFGIWMEPEMVSEDSALYRAHPDWALTVPGRDPAMGRNQLVLDLSRRDVEDWMYQTISDLLSKHRISYLKWDFNRSVTDAFSRALPPERQGEVPHRYMLGLYSLLDRLTAAFPEVLFEGCAGGGGRYDAGMLAYFPQIWCSDDTDPVERLQIQRGSSFGYPVSACGAHVSASPNHQTGRQTPFGTRGLVAMSGTFGYELDPTILSDGEKEQIRTQIGRVREYADLIREGDLYRLGDEARGPAFSAWEFVAPDRSEALLCLVVTHPEANPAPLHLRLRGLDEEAGYRVMRREFYGCALPVSDLKPEDAAERPALSGAALMRAGCTLPRMYGDYPSVLIHWTKA